MLYLLSDRKRVERSCLCTSYRRTPKEWWHNAWHSRYQTSPLLKICITVCKRSNTRMRCAFVWKTGFSNVCLMQRRLNSSVNEHHIQAIWTGQFYLRVMHTPEKRSNWAVATNKSCCVFLLKWYFLSHLSCIVESHNQSNALIYQREF